jgi:riboflavin kinase/FMN adenylyltransferase
MITVTSFTAASLQGSVLATVGTFDGVHRGHRYLLEQSSVRAHEHGYHLAVITFDPCPAVVLRPQIGRYQLTTASQKLRVLEEIDPALTVLLPFTPALAQLSADHFLDAMEGRLQLREIWMGEDFRFGHAREGGLDLLVQRGGRDGFSVHVVERTREDRATISSSRIRALLATGDVTGVIPLLGRPFALELSPDQLSFRPSPRHTVAMALSVPAHLALPAPGAYAALVSGPDSRGRPEPALARVDPDPSAPVDIATLHSLPDTGAVEFIEQLAGDDTTDLLIRAVERGDKWKRPRFVATGVY